MAAFKCKMCGGNLEITEGMTVCECEYCGTKQTVPNADDEKKINLFNRANRLRSACEFDKAATIYESIVSEFSEEAEAYWGLCLCKFGIEYVDDPKTAKKIPTCHRTSYSSIFDDSDFELACEYADSVALQIYRSEAKEIDRLQKEILNIAKNEQPFDIFICYKESDENGQRTVDSELAHDLYDVLSEKGYKVFYARITLKAKLGQDYEPYIFSALNSAKVMLAVGTKYEYYNAVWVKNEWNRFLALMSNNKEKMLIPCYKDIDAYDMPKEFNHLQGQDLSSPRAFQDLISNVERIIPSSKNTPLIANTEQKSVFTSVSSTAEPLLKRAFICLEDEEWNKADELLEQVLNQEPENPQAYLGKFCIDMELHNMHEIADLKNPIDENNGNYRKIMRFADERLKNELIGYTESIISRINDKRYNDQYNIGVEIMNSAKTSKDYEKAKTIFQAIGGFKDSDKLSEQCEHLITDTNVKAYTSAVGKMNSAKNVEDYTNAIQEFSLISGYKDSKELIEKCISSMMDSAKNVKDYANAIKAFSLIIGYKDSKELIEKYFSSIMRYADSKEELLSAQQILESSEWYKNSNYKDRLEKLCEEYDSYFRYYRNAMTAIKNDDYERAEYLLSFIEGFLDSDELSEHCREMINEQQLQEREKEKKQEEYIVEENLKKQYRSNGLCQYCGGEFRGFFTKTCSVCGKEKDY